MTPHIWRQFSPTEHAVDYMCVWFVCNRCGIEFPAAVDMASPGKPDPYVAARTQYLAGDMYEDCDLSVTAGVLDD